MAETNVNYVTKNEFRLVAVGLAALLVIGLWPTLRQAQVHPYKVPADMTATRSTPIVVRGGAMTAFAEHSKWSQVSATTYCLDIKKIGDFYVNFDDEADPSKSNSWVKPKIIEIYGHDINDMTGTKPSPNKNGLKFILQQTDCSGNTGHESVQINSVGGAYYSLHFPAHGTHGDGLRYLVDPLAGCAKDQDLCERMAAVFITDSAGSSTPPLPCPDGDCSVSIGIQ
jgi:hypothetical protein